MAVHVSNGSRMMLVMVVAVCVIGATARPSHKATPAPTPKPTPPPLPKIVIPSIRTLQIDTQTAASAGVKQTPCGAVLALSTGVGIKIKQDNTNQQADAQTGAQGGCGSLFALVQSGTKTKVSGKDPLSADSTTTLIGVKGITVGISHSTTGAVIPSKKHGVPGTAIASVAQASGIASNGQKTTHAGSGTVTTDGITVTNTAGDSIKAEVQQIIAKHKCLKGGKGCPTTTLPTTKPPTLPTLPTLKSKKLKH